ncbi:peptide/nickel transport system substrate-binding protein [Streptomyces sp. 2224.1]|uniref:ABC transporter substrate-binding protein n=1 Tax=unclassified Streptomyces TaxID=2593676 RepID=UPI000880E196|nr:MULTISPECIES: ABC transporter substrate-binding protein [unclassified Streptomyces]PBC84863.1 peptide/nickel transport system substrate-binding protein [Streptomyces sp. 2321.6]SDR25486.1 peptide/nickel transport system substrate-binding protein [Streptomyces sp. KS_16]SEB60033.1 peptide/nickel transport system substrate-binding protein [Streptomyces sp. 2224.1]SED47312.1 peptide/nickel transport system substrate-binding protein [Streptomyces sp. 2133.1]SEE38902.1 peptide/nickel transport s
MNTLSTRRTRAVIVALAAGSLTLTACSGGSGSGNDKAQTDKDAAAQSKVVPLGTAAQSNGPAAAVAGARNGGTITVYQRDSFNHLDPAQQYVSDVGDLAKLIFRGLTTYTQDDKGNKTLVGDLATDAGQMSDGGKTWKYTLKDGIKFEDGKPITSKDIRHSIERMYAPFVNEGPTYIQQWLSGGGTSYRKALPDGPYKGDHLPKSVLDTPDDKTVVFHFKKPQTQLPYALAMAGYSAVPDSAKDTKDNYDVAPVTSGPYKIASFKAGKSMQLVRNKNWDPKTDPSRHQYVDGYNISFNHQFSDSTKRLKADQGEDKTAISFTNAVEPTLTKQVLDDPSASKRLVQGYQPYVWQLNMNMDRIKDKRIRDAITYAVPSQQVVRIEGGSYGGEVAGGLLSPTVAGYEKGYDPYGKLKKPNGDPEKAKKLLKEAGKVGMKLVYAYANTEIRQNEAVAIANGLTQAGFNVQKKEVDSSSWYQQMGKVKNGFDVYLTGWGQDWPDASTVIPPSYDGSTIEDGATNYSHIRDQHVTDEIKRIQQIPDVKKQTAEWQKLHHYIVEKVNPAVPVFYVKLLQLYGSKIGGVRYNTDTNYLDVNTLFIKK